MSNFYEQLISALQSALTRIQCMVTHANTSCCNSVVRHKQCEYCTNVLRLLETCALEVVSTCVLDHGIHVAVT